MKNRNEGVVAQSRGSKQRRRIATRKSNVAEKASLDQWRQKRSRSVARAAPAPKKKLSKRPGAYLEERRPEHYAG